MSNRVIWRLFLLALLALSTLGPSAGSASAAYLHPAQTGKLGVNGLDDTPFGGDTVTELDYDNVQKRLYVLRSGLYTVTNGDIPPQAPRGIYAYDNPAPGVYTPAKGFPIETSNPAGKQFWMTVDESTGNIYYAEDNTLYSFDSSGVPREGFPVTTAHRGCGAAFDPSGLLWVTNATDHAVYRYTPDGELLSEISTADLPDNYFCQIKFDKSNGDMWLSHSSLNNLTPAGLVRYTAASGYSQHGPVLKPLAKDFALDPSSGIIYKSRFLGGSAGWGVEAINTDGAVIEAFDTTQLEGANYNEVAFNQGTGEVYVLDQTCLNGHCITAENGDRGWIDIWPGAVVPNVTTGGPTQIGHTGATLTGHVDPAGGPGAAGCEFAYGTDTSYSLGSVPCVPAASQASPLNSPTDVTADLSGLTTGTTYHYRLVASNANGTNFGLDHTVTPQPVLASTGAATDVERSTATLNGTVNPEGLTTTFYFQYGTSTGYGQTSAVPPGGDVGTTSPGDQPVSAPIGGLTAGKTYHYRIVAVNSNGTSYGLDRTFDTAPAVKGISTDAASDVLRTSATLNATLDPDSLSTTYYFEWGKTVGYGQSTPAPPGVDAGTTAPGATPVATPLTGLVPATTYHYRVVAVNSFGTTRGADRTLTTVPAVRDVSTAPATAVTPSGATLNGSLDPDGLATTSYFQWGKSSAYGHFTATPPGDDVGTLDPGSLALSAGLSNLEPGTTYHYRLVGVNSFGPTKGADRTFTTPQAPTIESVYSINVTATGAELKARIDPNGFETKYRFEYGTSENYGSLAPAPDGVLAAGDATQSITVALSGLQSDNYHFRLRVESQWGVSTSEDQTFSFNPPNCPNSTVRQQTGAAYLPDCRAYELVSPANAGGAALFPVGPSSPAAIDRFAFTGAFNAIPGTGNPPNAGFGDLYVASRTIDGWLTRYVGLPGDQTLAQWGPPGGTIDGTAGMLASADMDKLLVWSRAQDFLGGGGGGVLQGSYAPYLWDNEGNSLGRLPTNLQEVPGSTTDIRDGGFVGAARPSPDFSHYVFSTLKTAFAPGGLTDSPGSVYDNDLGAGTVTIASRTAAGADIPIDPSVGKGGEFIQVPAVSTDGSHILMSTLAPGGATHLYMRVDGAVTYDISVGADAVNHGVRFEGMTADGSVVYFTTRAQMTADDHDASIDLYRWSEQGGSLTRISVGDNGYGDSDACAASWIAGTGCDVEVVPTDTHGNPLDQTNNGLDLGQPIDTAIASRSGDVYFYSPEQLEGAHGIPGKRNLYVWRSGEVRHVATLDSAAAATRINVSADGAHMALITKSQLTPYDNAGHAEMYRYDAATRTLRCVSCLPDGSPPSFDVEGAQNGLFMADDGRTFFATRDPLVPRDADGILDVYEYSGGRAQLISSGRGDQEGETVNDHMIGLVGVSPDGVNAFFSTFDTLVAQDQNGGLLKFYDARVSGGYPYNSPPAPCAAADECHGAGSESLPAPQIGSGADLGVGGNANKATKKKKRKHRHAHRRHHRAKHKHGRKHKRGAGR